MTHTDSETLPPDAFPAALPAGARLRSGTAARLAGVPVATLRVWERRYGVVAAPKTATGQRLYSGHDVQRLRLIKQLTECGHAIGTLATLPLPELQALAAGEPAVRLPARRLVVVGRGAARKLQAVGVVPQAVLEDLDQAEAGARGLAADLLLVQLPSLHAALAERLLVLQQRLQATTLVVLYAFGAEAVAESLRSAGASVRREPASGRELATLLGGSPQPLPAATANPVAAAPAVAPRRYSDEALAALAEMPSSVICECPRHVAEIVLQLAGFERYSADCDLRNPADAALHRHLGEVAAQARTLFEQALARLVSEEGLELPRAQAAGA